MQRRPTFDQGGRNAVSSSDVSKFFFAVVKGDDAARVQSACGRRLRRHVPHPAKAQVNEQADDKGVLLPQVEEHSGQFSEAGDIVKGDVEVVQIEFVIEVSLHIEFEAGQVGTEDFEGSGNRRRRVGGRP